MHGKDEDYVERENEKDTLLVFLQTRRKTNGVVERIFDEEASVGDENGSGSDSKISI